MFKSSQDIWLTINSLRTAAEVYRNLAKKDKDLAGQLTQQAKDAERIADQIEQEAEV